MQNQFDLQIDTSADRFSYLAHGFLGAIAGVVATSYVGKPVQTAFAFAASLVLTQIIPHRVEKWMLEGLPNSREEDYPANGGRLPKALPGLADELNLSEPPSLHVLGRPGLPPHSRNKDRSLFSRKVETGLKRVFHPSVAEFTLSQGAWAALGEALEDRWDTFSPTTRKIPSALFESRPARTLRKTIEKATGNTANAAAFGTGPFGMYMSRPAFDAVTDLEGQKGIAAHELGHVAAGHLRKTEALTLVQTTANVTMVLNTAGLLLSSLGGVEVLTAAVIANRATRFAFNALKIDLERDEGKALLGSVTRFAMLGSMVAVAAVTKKKEILTAFAAAATVFTANKLIRTHMARSFEFQADRLSGDATHNPIAHANALKSLVAFEYARDPNFLSRDYKRGPVLMRPYLRVKAMFHSHPHVDRRIERLNKMAVSQGTASTASLG